MDGEPADRLSDMARFRNLLVHQYTEIDNHKIHEILRKNLDDFEKFMVRIEELLEKERPG